MNKYMFVVSLCLMYWQILVSETVAVENGHLQGQHCRGISVTVGIACQGPCCFLELKTLPSLLKSSRHIFQYY